MKNVQLLFFLFTVFCIPLQSQNTINIPGDYPTIQQGINAASNGDLVLVADGTYIENIDFNGKAITVASHFIQDGNKSHIENTIIDGSQPSHPDTGSVVLFNSGEDTTSVLKGFTIKNGTGTLGPGIGIGVGGGILVYNSGALIINNIIEYNSINDSLAYGGGICVGLNSISTTILRYNIIRNNTVIGTRSGFGGGICLASNGPTYIENNIITSNYNEALVYPLGGGIELVNCGFTFIQSNKVTDNQAIGTYASGGGIDLNASIGELFIHNNFIKGNSTTQTTLYGGGGIDLYHWNSSVTVSNNLIVENNGYKGGGVLMISGSGPIPFLVNNTIAYNSGEIGGGVHIEGLQADIMNSIIWGNTYNSGGQIYGSANVTYSNVEGGFTGTGNMNVDPIFIDFTYFCLCDTSQCVDAGNPDPMYYDVEDPDNPGYALFPALGSLTNDMGAFGGPNSTWSSIILDTLRVPTDYATIQEAIDAAMNGNVVLVDEGTYYENINFKGKAITVASYFLVDEDTSHISNTIINGSQPSHPDSGSVVYFISGEDTNSILYGFTITGGSGTPYYVSPIVARAGGGIFILNSSATIKNNIIEYNYIEHSTDAWGGGIFAWNSDEYNFVIENNLVRDNFINTPYVDYYSLGGGIYTMSNWYVLIANNKVIDNKITAPVAYGGGISPYGGGDCSIINNYVSGNIVNSSSGGSGGIDIYYRLILRNNLIVNNSAPLGGGVLIEFSNSDQSLNNARGLSVDLVNDNHSQLSFSEEAFLENNTIVNNNATISGGGIRVIGVYPELMNFIIWGNTAPSNPQISGTAIVQYSDVEGGYNGTGNINEDPMFDDPTYCVLNTLSPCIDMGNPDPMYNDIEDPSNPGNALLPARGTLTNDMGCFGGPNSLWWSWDIPVSVEKDETITGIPNEYALSQNYPNPFNPTTTIKYGIPERSFVELKVYDILGREITTIVSEELDSGYYGTNFNAVNLSSGIYFYQIKAGHFIETKKMILLK